MISEIESECPMESLRVWLRSGNPPEDSSRRRQIRSIAAFLQDCSAGQTHSDRDRIVVAPAQPLRAGEC